ncbi:hypothetical protein BJ742DRAFT_402517 [Cladochytrium replicatum]|nr:hypothetical protein BJ742DRAFT_402517 [Cladochytrium replicatum]
MARILKRPTRCLLKPPIRQCVSGLLLFAAFFSSVAHALPNYGGYGADVTPTTTPCNGEVEGATATPDVGYGATSTPSVEGENVTTTDVGYGATSTPAVQGEESGSTPCESATTTTPEAQGEVSGTTPCESATSTPAVEGEASGTTPCDESTPTPTVQGEDEDCDEYEDEETTPGVEGGESTPTSTVEAAAAYLQSSASRTSSNFVAFFVAGAALAASVVAF